jgi:antitoxin component of RelBE/YafQ-DinJ toxin-antitoxin module
MRTTIRINEGLRRQAMEAAEKQGRTFTSLVEEAIAKYLADQRAKPLDLPVARSFKLPPGKTIEQYIKDIQEEDDIEMVRKMMNGAVSPVSMAALRLAPHRTSNTS